MKFYSTKFTETKKNKYNVTIRDVYTRQGNSPTRKQKITHKLDIMLLFILGFQLSTAIIRIVDFLQVSKFFQSRISQELIRVSRVLYQCRYLGISTIYYTRTKSERKKCPFKISFNNYRYSYVLTIAGNI